MNKKIRRGDDWDEVEGFDRSFRKSAFWPPVLTVLGIGFVFGLLVFAERMEGPPQIRGEGDLPRVFADPTTGCEYLVYAHKGITPRLGADGAPMCVAASKAVKP
jgi:hypothetical protein